MSAKAVDALQGLS